MMFRWHDKQFIDMLHLTNTEAPEYKDPTLYLNDPDMISYQMKGKVSRDMEDQQIVALIWFYLENMPVLQALFDEAVKLFISKSSRHQIHAAGINLPSVGGYEFVTPAWKSAFFSQHFSGEKDVDGVGP